MPSQSVGAGTPEYEVMAAIHCDRAGPAAGASYTLIGAIIVLGAIGYAIDAWRGTGPWGLIIGLMLGIVVGMWELAKTVWRK